MGYSEHTERGGLVCPFDDIHVDMHLKRAAVAAPSRPALSGVVLLVPWVPASLALVFHLADGHRGPVGFASTLRALHWSAYLETHARRCYGVAQDGEADTARRILERITKGDLPREGFGTRDVWRGGQAWPIKSGWRLSLICW